MEDRAAQLCKRLSQLKAERTRFEPHWRECYKYGAPERQQAFDGEDIDDTRSKQRAELLDSTASEAIQLLVSSIISGTTPANSIWFKAVPDGMDDPAELTPSEHWLEMVCQFIWRNIHGSNFDSDIFDVILDFVTAGWAVIYTDIDRKLGGGYMFQSWPIGECWIASTRQDYKVDTIYREYRMTAQQIIGQFGEHKVSQAVRDASTKSPDQTFKILHVIEPRANHKQSVHGVPTLPKNMPFASYHIEIENKVTLKESGYNEFPCAVPRMRKIPGSIYGVGQMSIALPDAKTINALMRDTLRSAEIDVLGVWIAEDDGVLNPRTIRLGGGKIITANSVDSMKRMDSGSNFQVSDQLLDRFQNGIRKKLMADQLTSPYGQPMTAAETYMRVDTIRQMLGPLYGRAQSELLQSLLERCFGLAYRAGVLGEAPEEMQGRAMSFKFVSPLARAQQLEEVAAIERFMGIAGTIAEVDPNAIDNFNSDAAMQVAATGLGVPTSVMRTREEIEAVREQKAQAQQQAQAQEQQAVMAQQMTGAVTQGMGKGLEAQMVSEVMQ